MPTINTEPMTSEIEGDFVVFLNGMRINALWKVHKWLPVLRAEFKLLKRLKADPDSGLLDYESRAGLRNNFVIMYWRSLDDLRSFATDPDDVHVPAWSWYNDRIGESGDVGIWNEIYLVTDGRYEAMYRNMPPIGLGRAADFVPMSRPHRRLGLTDDAALADEAGGHRELVEPE